MEEPAADWGVNSTAGRLCFWGFLRLAALSGAGTRCASDEGTVTQFATTTSAGCMTCSQKNNAPLKLHNLSRSTGPHLQMNILEPQHPKIKIPVCDFMYGTRYSALGAPLPSTICGVFRMTGMRGWLCQSCEDLHLWVVQVGLAMGSFQDDGQAVSLPVGRLVGPTQQSPAAVRHQRCYLQDLQSVTGNLVTVPARKPMFISTSGVSLSPSSDGSAMRVLSACIAWKEQSGSHGQCDCGWSFAMGATSRRACAAQS